MFSLFGCTGKGNGVLTESPGINQIVDYLPSESPRLLVVVDTEEEFPWDQPHSRQCVSVDAMSALSIGQAVFDRFGLKPTYVIDYPVASQTAGFEPLREIYDQNACTVGAHLHPWVNPPFLEELTKRNTFPGNLPEEVEKAKLSLLTEEIEKRFVRPNVYKAGRYGVGPNTASILKSLGYTIDMSPTPGFSYSKEGGPNFSQFPASPYWFSKDQLCLPCTGGFVGAFRTFGPLIYPGVDRKLMRKLKAGGILSRLRLLERIRISPEGFTTEEMISLTKTLYRGGVRTFTLSFHSPTLQPGNTPYVQTQSELNEFLETIRRYLEFFFGEFQGQPSMPDAVFNDLRLHASV